MKPFTLGDEHLDEAIAKLNRLRSSGVDAIEIGHEVSHRGRLQRLLHHRDIQLSELMGHE